MTVADKRKPDFHEWWLMHFLPDLTKIQRGVFRKNGLQIPIRIFKIGGDHCELFSLFTGVGGPEHRSAFCASKLSERLECMHKCPRLSLQGMHDSGFTCHFASRFVNDCFTVTPALHDIKGVMQLVVKSLPDGRDAARTVIGESKNQTGSQSRQILLQLMRSTERNQLILCYAMEALIFFRFQDIPVRFHFDNDCSTEFFYSLIAYHSLMFLLEWGNEGVTHSAYAHSVEHWFDPEDAHRLTLSDELFEQINGERKRWAKNTSQATMERDLQMFELQSKHRRDVSTSLPQFSWPTPHLYSYDTIILCRCVQGKSDVWKQSAKSLNKRLETLGLGGHVGSNSRWGQKYHAKESHEETNVLKICVCDEQPWSGQNDDSDEPPDETSEESSEHEEHLCVICDTNFPSKESLFGHYDSQHRPTVVCVCKGGCPWPGCDKTNLSIRGISQHVLYNHIEDLTPKICPLCTQRFRSKSDRIDHMKQCRFEFS